MCESNMKSMSPNPISPYGSPVKYSPIFWSQMYGRIGGHRTFDRDLSSDMSVQLISRTLQEEQQTLSQIRWDFEANGREVPIKSSAPITDRQSTQPIVRFSMPPPPPEPPKPYELFGRNVFSYASHKNCRKEWVNKYGCKGSLANDNNFEWTAIAVDNNNKKKKRRVKSETFCKFCKNNNETPEVYSSHVCKDPNGVVVCPILRNYDCPVCHSGGGDSAHTLRYCPLNGRGVSPPAIPSVIKKLKNGRSADGRKRFNSLSS